MITEQDLAPHVETGHVRVNEWRDYRIYNYTERCTFDRAWSGITTQARGLIFDPSGELVARPFPKFFNHNEPDAVIPPGDPDEVTVKEDGSLGILFAGPDGPKWSTRGRIDSPQAAIADELWRDLYGCPPTLDGWTVLAEIIHPGTKVIVHYDEPSITVLAARHIETGQYMDRAALLEWFSPLGVPVVAASPHRTLADAVADAGEITAQHEGWVLRWGDHRVKVKGDQYKAVARLMAGINERRAADMWVAGATPDGWALVPEETRQWVEGVWADLNGDLRQMARTATKLRKHPAWKVDRKEFAQAFKGMSLFSELMREWSGRWPDYRAAVYRARFGAAPRPVK